MQQNVLKDDLLSLIRDNKFGRYCEDPDLPIELSVQLTFDGCRKLLERKDPNVFSYIDNSSVLQGLLFYRKSGWDTEHFNKPTAVIENIYTRNDNSYQKTEIVFILLKQLLKWCDENHIEFIFTRISAMDLITIHCLEELGFNFIESWIFNKFTLNKLKKGEVLIKLRYAVDSDLEYMILYAQNAFITQRFHADQHITYEQAEAVYPKLINEAFYDKEKKILVYEENNIPLAFMIYSHLDLKSYYNLKFAVWKLAIIDPNQRGKGIGSAFFKAVMDHHCDEGIDIVDSSLSIRNIASLNTHNKIGFKVICSLVTMHRWSK
jgi:RimJ/RimL family protein N-acetyltransferase